VTDPYDYNRDGIVNEDDELLARNHETNFLTGLQIITAPQMEMAPAFLPASSEISATDAQSSAVSSPAALPLTSTSSEKELAGHTPIAPLVLNVPVIPARKLTAAPLVIVSQLPVARPKPVSPTSAPDEKILANGLNSQYISKPVILITSKTSGGDPKRRNA
jgi:hypothetical protein